MDLAAAIGLFSSFVTIEEAGRCWRLIVKDKLKKKKVNINNWDSNDPVVQACLDRFKTDMGNKYKDHIFSEELKQAKKLNLKILKSLLMANMKLTGQKLSKQYRKNEKN